MAISGQTFLNPATGNFEPLAVNPPLTLVVVTLTDADIPATVVQLPITPQEIPDSDQADPRQYRVIGLGQHSYPIGRNEETYTLDGYLPGAALRVLPHVIQAAWAPPDQIRQQIRSWMRANAKLIYTTSNDASPLNVPVYISKYQFTRTGWAGNLKFSISLTEWRTITIRLDDGSGSASGPSIDNSAAGATVNDPGAPQTGNATPDSSDTVPDPPIPAVYVVQDGDTLSAIAKRFLGDTSKWTDIFDANSSQLADGSDGLTDPSLILPGQQLTIPGGQSGQNNASWDPSRQGGGGGENQFP